MSLLLIAAVVLCLLVVVVVGCSVVVGARADRVFEELKEREETQ